MNLAVGDRGPHFDYPLLIDGEASGCMLVLGDRGGLQYAIFYPCGEYLQLGTTSLPNALCLLRANWRDLAEAAARRAGVDVDELWA